MIGYVKRTSIKLVIILHMLIGKAKGMAVKGFIFGFKSVSKVAFDNHYHNEFFLQIGQWSFSDIIISCCPITVSPK